jgi:arylsulfatase
MTTRLLLAFLLALSSASYAKDDYATANRNGSNPGTSSKLCKAIQRRVDPLSKRDSLKKAGLSVGGRAVASSPFGQLSTPAEKPNIVVIMVDDMGFSDLGCFGGEIDTPNLDRLAGEGIRFSQFYNTGKCSPSRQALMTGRYFQDVTPALNNSMTIAEVLRTAGYFTCMTGKWHHPRMQPTHRGFDRYFGHSSGLTNYFTGDETFQLNGEKFEVPQEGFYTTHAVADYAIRFVCEAGRKKRPFFLYVAFNAPHYPLQAPEKDIRKYKGRFSKGWDLLRQERHKRQVEMGLFEKSCSLSPRPHDVPAWKDLSKEEQEKQAYLMEIYAAMIDIVDQSIGRLFDHLKKTGDYDNTAFFFFSDNGGEGGQGTSKQTREENLPGSDPRSFWTYNKPWANVSNTPFRLEKMYQHEGGIASPMIAWHPKLIRKKGGISHRLSHLVDIMATCIDLSGAKYPARFNNMDLKPLDGKSLLPDLQSRESEEHEALFFQFLANRAIRTRAWKLVQRSTPHGTSVNTMPWELYRPCVDSSELEDLADKYPETVQRLRKQWDDWYQLRHGAAQQSYPLPNYVAD